MKILLSDHFTYTKLFRFTLPSVVMMIFTSVYSVVDGVFVSNFVGKTAFAAVNLMFPFLMFLGVVGFMIGTGGSAYVAKLLGKQMHDKARSSFSLLVCTGFVLGVLFSFLAVPMLPVVARMLGAEGVLLNQCVIYGRILLFSLPFFILQNIFQPFMVVAERPDLGLYITVFAGVLNILLDYIFIVVLGLGISGAAWASACAELSGGLLPLAYFLFSKKSRLSFSRPKYDNKVLLNTLSNGLSEFFSSISGTIVSMCYNFQLIRYLGEDGVAAFGVIMYVQFIFFAVFLGYAIGSAPIISYNYGARNDSELRNVFYRSIKIIALLGIVLTTLLEIMSRKLTSLFVGYDPDLHDLACTAMRIYGFSYLLVGFNFFASSFFTALNNGVVSAILATVRALVFETAAVFVIPLLFGVNGIWFSVSFAETAALFMSLVFLDKYKHKYHYALKSDNVK